jgi:hypothetical protein
VDYFDFDLWIRAAVEANLYPVSVTNSPSGPASTVMNFNVNDPHFHELLAPVMAAIEEEGGRDLFGKLLFDSLFSGPVRDAWQKSRGQADALPDQGIRLRLWIDAPELAVLPWELLKEGADFLAVSGRVVVSRFLPAGEPPAFITPQKARVLIVVQEPAQLPIDPDVAAGLANALNTSKRFAPPKILKNSTLAQINQELLDGYEVLHYIGHGSPDKLLLASDKEVDIKDGHAFAALFTGQPTLQLVVLNVCASGATTPRGVFSGLGPFLSEKRLPAVIAMQYSAVLQKTAAEFNASFYAALDESISVDVAVNSARLALLASHPGGRDWSTPVLYMTTRSGRVLEFVDNPVQAAIRAAELAKERAEMEAGYREMIVALGEIAVRSRQAEGALDALTSAERLQLRFNSLQNQNLPTRQEWDQIRQIQIADLQSVLLGSTSETASWWRDLLSNSQVLSEKLDNSDFGLARAAFSDIKGGLAVGIGGLRRDVKDILRDSQKRSSDAIARIRVE